MLTKAEIFFKNMLKSEQALLFNNVISVMNKINYCQLIFSLFKKEQLFNINCFINETAYKKLVKYFAVKYLLKISLF